MLVTATNNVGIPLWYLPCQAFEELSHCHKVKLVRTIEYHTLDCESLG